MDSMNVSANFVQKSEKNVFAEHTLDFSDTFLDYFRQYWKEALTNKFPYLEMDQKNYEYGHCSRNEEKESTLHKIQKFHLISRRVLCNLQNFYTNILVKITIFYTV